MKLIDELVLDICDVLQIDVPEVKIVKRFESPTMLGRANEDGTEIEIKRSIALDELQLAFVLSHELRHIWQSRTNYDYWFAGYLVSENKDFHIAEIDANAFAYLYMMHYYNLQPSFPNDIITRIEKRAFEILKEGLVI